MKKTTIITLLMMLVCSVLASALSWNQWLPSPTNNALTDVVSFDNGRAFAITLNAASCFKFYIDTWSETYCPDDTLSLSTYSFKARIQRLNDKAILVYTKTNSSKIIVYDSNTDTFSLDSTIDFQLSQDSSTGTDDHVIVCPEISGYCYAQGSTNYSIYKVYPSFSYITEPPHAADRIMLSNFGLYTSFRPAGFWTAIAEWNNFSWNNKTPTMSLTYLSELFYVSPQEKYFFSYKSSGVRGYIYPYNYTVGLFITSNPLNSSYNYSNIGFFVIDNDLFSSDGSNFFKVNTIDNTNILMSSASSNRLSYNVVSGFGWSVGAGGRIDYLLGESTTSFTLTRGISSGVYNGVANFWAVPTTSNSPAVVGVEIFSRQDGGSLYAWDWLDVPTGYNASNTISGAAWGNFVAGKTYNVIYTLTDHANNVLTFNDSWAVTAQSQGGFNITPLTASFNHACVGQTILFNINANNSANNPLTYDYSCDGDKYPLTNYFRFNEFPCAYNTVGNRTVYGYAWDDYSYDNPQSSSIVINISSTCITNYTILGKVYDFDTGLAVVGANVTLDDGQTALSDVNGNVAFFVADNRLYAVTITKSDYYTKSTYGSVDGFNGWIITRIGGSEGGVRTSLIVHTIAENGSVVSGSLVSVLEPISGESKFGITDALGVYVFVDMMIGDRIVVSASNEPKHFEATGDYISLTYGETKEITLTMSQAMRTGVYYGNSRFCVDPLKGVLLCGNLSVTGVGSGCTVDADCISDRCMPSKQCSTFNWTVCDIHGITRGQYCFTRSIAEGGLSGLTNIIFSFFIFVCVILFIIGVFILVRKKNN